MRVQLALVHSARLGHPLPPLPSCPRVTRAAAGPPRSVRSTRALLTAALSPVAIIDLPCAGRHPGRRCGDRATAPCNRGTARTRRRPRGDAGGRVGAPRRLPHTPCRRRHRSRKSSGSGIRLDAPNGVPGSVSQDFLTTSAAFSGDAPGSTPNAAAIDVASACGSATIRHELDEVGEADSGTRRPQATATARRRQRRASPSSPCARSTAGMESRRPGLESRPQDTGSDNVNGHDPNRNTRLRPSARRLAKETATFARRLWRSARQHRPPHGPAAVGKEAP